MQDLISDATYQKLLAKKLTQPSEKMYRFLVKTAPEELWIILDSGRLKPSQLVFAVEIAGKARDQDQVREHLTKFLHHEDAMVRESAVMALKSHINTDIRKELRIMQTQDPHPGLRELVTGILGS
jgi:hypothetical protein